MELGEMMKAVRLQSYGDVDQFLVEEIPVPEPGPGEMLIRVEVSAVNPFDIILRRGLRQNVRPLSLPATLGTDAAGVVVRVGPGVARFRPGDRVIADFPHNGRGAHAEFGVVPETAATLLPDNVSFEEGATLPKAGLTGRQTVTALGVGAGATVLVSGALGVVGRAAVQYLKEIHAVPVAGVRPDRVDEARRVAGEALDITVAPTTPSFDYAISTAAPVMQHVIDHVRKDGTVVNIVPEVPASMSEHAASKQVRLVQVRHRTDAETLSAVAAAAASGALRIPVARVLSFAELGQAHRLVEEGAAGKVLIKPWDRSTFGIR